MPQSRDILLLQQPLYLAAVVINLFLDVLNLFNELLFLNADPLPLLLPASYTNVDGFMLTTAEGGNSKMASYVVTPVL